MTKIIGLTGGIGSGKTTIAQLFIEEGIPVYFADAEAKKIMNQTETVKLVTKALGTDFIEDNLIDTKALATIVFNDPEKLKRLNGILHPLVKKDFENWTKSNSDHSFVIKEAAILFESGSYQYCDQVITVVADQETRIKRVMDRDHCTREQVLDRIKNQWTDMQRISKSDYVIHNESLQEARVQFEVILKKLKNQY
jgi:dephospho-CoA kinase